MTYKQLNQAGIKRCGAPSQLVAGQQKQYSNTSNIVSHERYVLLEGEATVVIDEESVEIEAGDAVWILPTATRQIQSGDVESALVLVSAPASKCRTTTCVDDPGSWATNGFIG
ncbi:hypothetical protein [Halobacterium sp. BOL4-2]|uniref:hypothetical protein n=1 Tax=Halobacterium sp. BOL4-2 TaxID=2810537 RepID=UPI001E38637D|nr:hypothetical protein [Halobacterium sp. BOL4-2]UDF60557.1 hypothetical protein JRZ79_13485 [Halobacterium sp. BOL4-2]